MSIKDIIQRNFSRFADKYEAYCGIQDHAASKLIELAEAGEPKNILDIGCGPGNYTGLLRDRFPASAITAVDISKDMIRIAKGKLSEKNIKFITADAETIDFTEKFGLITSNASFQWLGNRQAALSRYKNMLSEGGYILFSMFGPATFNELNLALAELYENHIPITAHYFDTMETIEKTLAQNFQQVHIAEELVKKNYTFLWQLLNTIKYTGTRGVGLKGKRLSKQKIEELEKIYKAKFGSIIVTYQIFYCKAK